MALLADRYSTVSSDLLAFRKEQRQRGRKPRYVVTLSGTGKPTCRDTNATHEEWIHDPRDPVSRASSAVQALNLTGQTLVLVFRAGLGYLAVELVRRLSTLSPPIRVVIHEDRWELVWEALMTLDWSAVIPSPSVFLCWGEKADDELITVLRQHVSVLRDGLRVVPGSTLDGEGNESLQALVERVESVASCGRRHLASLARTLQRGSPKRAENEGVVLCGHAFEQFFVGFKLGLERNGVQVTIPDRSRAKSEFVSSPLSWIESCVDCPDIVASFNRSGFEPVELKEMGAAGVRRVMWFYDNPKRFDLTPEDLSQIDLILAFDPHHAAWLRSITDVPTGWLRTATGFLEEPRVARPARCSSPPRVSFVGSSGLRRMQGFASAMQNVLVPLRSRIEELIQRWRGRDPVKLHTELESLPIQSPQLSSGNLCALLEEYASMLLRLEYLRAAEPYGLKLFGDPGWAGTEIPGTLPSAYEGWGSLYWTETPWIYCNSLINLNIFHVQCMDSATVRVYDILACGGFLLTEYRPSLEEEFAVGHDLETFRTPEELDDKIKYYLAHDSQRSQIARNGQRRVLENYTYVQRGRDFLQRVRSLLT